MRNKNKKLQPPFIHLFGKWQQKKDARLSTEFLPEAIEIIEKPPSPLGHAMIWLMVLIMSSALLWSVIGKVDEVAVARGKIISIDNLQTVQPMTEGRIVEFYVQEGSYVKAGEQLLKFDSTDSEIQYESAQNNLEVLKTKNDLFRSFLNGEDIQSFLKLDLRNDNEQIYDYIASLQKDYLVKKKQCELTITQYEEEVNIQEKEVEKCRDNLAALQTQQKLYIKMDESVEPDEQILTQMSTAIEFAKKEAADYKILYEGGAVPKNEWLIKQNNVKSLEEEYLVQQQKINYAGEQKAIQFEQISNQLKEAEDNCIIQEKYFEQSKDKYLQSQSDLDSLNTETEKTIRTYIVDNNIQMDNIKSEVQKIQGEIDKSILYSPVDGIVQSIDVKSVGGVVTPAQNLITIAPSGTQIMMEASLLNKDIGFIYCGQSTSVKLDTYPFQQYGTLDGKVVFISPDSELNENKMLTYKIKVAFNTDVLQANGRENAVSSGMEGTVEIKTGRRRIINFFLDPFVKNMDESLKLR